MKIGIFTGAAGSQGTLQEQIDEIVQCENDGLDSVWAACINDVDSLTMLALAAEKTSKIEIGTAVDSVYQKHPLTMTQQALTVQKVAQGRFRLGIGLSHKPLVENLWNLTFHSPAKFMREYLTIINSLNTTGSSDFKGEFTGLTIGLTMQDRVEVPVLIAAMGKMMLKISGEMTDGTLLWMTGNKTIEQHIAPIINQAASNSNKPNPRVVAMNPVLVTDDIEIAKKAATEYFDRYGNLPSYRAMLDREGLENSSEIAIIGNESEVTEKLQEYADAGATDFAASIFKTGKNDAENAARTKDLLKNLVGKI